MTLAVSSESTKSVLLESSPNPEKQKIELWVVSIIMKENSALRLANSNSLGTLAALNLSFTFRCQIQTTANNNGTVKVDKCLNSHTSQSANLPPNYTKAKMSLILMVRFHFKEDLLTSFKLRFISKVIRN